MNAGKGNRKGRARTVQRVSCEAGSEQGQIREAVWVIALTAAAKTQNKQSIGALVFPLV